MLVLTRKVGSRVLIHTPEGRELAIMLLEIDRNQIRLGFEGDRAIVVLREEYQQKNQPVQEG